MDRRVRELGVTGVPFFILNDRIAVEGAQEPATLVAAFAEALTRADGGRDRPMTRTRAVQRMAWLSIATSIATLALKFGAYFLTGSVSLLSDAMESFVNLAAGMVALGALTYAARPADDEHHFGHDKAEYFASGVEGALILVAAASIIWAAVQRLLHPRRSRASAGASSSRSSPGR